MCGGLMTLRDARGTLDAAHTCLALIGRQATCARRSQGHVYGDSRSGNKEGRNFNVNLVKILLNNKQGDYQTNQ